MTGVILFLQQAGMKVNQFLIIYLGYFHKSGAFYFGGGVIFCRDYDGSIVDCDEFVECQSFIPSVTSLFFLIF